MEVANSRRTKCGRYHGIAKAKQREFSKQSAMPTALEKRSKMRTNTIPYEGLQ